ncbi:MAG: hypothetical protein ACM3QZ_06430 [Solirubrobacterales bacterium]
MKVRSCLVIAAVLAVLFGIMTPGFRLMGAEGESAGAGAAGEAAVSPDSGNAAGTSQGWAEVTAIVQQVQDAVKDVFVPESKESGPNNAEDRGGREGRKDASESRDAKDAAESDEGREHGEDSAAPAADGQSDAAPAGAANSPARLETGDALQNIAGQVAGPFFPYNHDPGQVVVVQAEGMQGRNVILDKVAASSVGRRAFLFKSGAAKTWLARISMGNVLFTRFSMNWNQVVPGMRPSQVWIGSTGAEPVDAQGVSMVTSEIAAEELDNGINLLQNYWTVEPENDLPGRAPKGSLPALRGSRVKMVGHSLRMERVSIPNFSITVGPMPASD